MTLSWERLASISAETGFRADAAEKVVHLLNLLNALNAHPFLKNKLALKGGTALNLFFFDIPRLSVDIDLNYIEDTSREEMLAAKPRIERAAQAVFSREGLTVRKAPDEHAGGKRRLSFQSAMGRSGAIEVDLNYMFRTPLWNVQRGTSRSFGGYQAIDIPVMDIHELAAGKLAALLARRQARDLFDAHQLLSFAALDESRLRVAFVVYGALNRKDWRTVRLADVAFNPRELKHMLMPLLRERLVAANSPDFAQKLIEESQAWLACVLPLREAEIGFLDRLLDTGQIAPELLTEDSRLQQTISRHPMLLWKAQNVRSHYGS